VSLVAGVDSSTQSTTVEVRDADTGEVVGRGRAPHPPTAPPVSEQDPAHWWAALEAAWTKAGSGDVAAVSVAGQQHGLVALDGGGRVIRPAKLWNDTESAPDARWLIARAADMSEDDDGMSWLAHRTGSVPVASFTSTKLSWLHRSEPESWARLAHVVLPHDWLTFRLTGELVTDRGDASGTGYWSPSDGGYCWDVLAIIDEHRDWPAALPRVLGPLEPAGTWGTATVGPGTGDNMAAALGLAVRPGDVVVSVGTSGTASTASDCPVADPSGAVAGFADAAGRFLPLVCILNAARVTDAVASLLGLGVETFDAMALASQPGADGLTLVPWFDGERTPNRPDASGLLRGLRTDVTAEQVARAAVEGVVCGLLDGLDALAATGVNTDGRLLLVGGGARSPAYRRVLADLSGRVVTVPTVVEAVAAGAAVQAAAVLDGTDLTEIAEAWGLGRGDDIEPAEVDRSAIRQAYSTACLAADG